MTKQFISISELAALTGLSAHTLRFYEKAGVLQAANRADNGHRRYNSQDVLVLAFVLRLKQTGMPLAEIREYAQLRAQGEMSLQERLTMLKLHRQRLATTISELVANASALDDKIQIYQKMISNKPGKKKKV
ncbi:MerR family transcriptional regulator [Undibacterium sp. Di27W]|uniref:MerR family transcriptional regulator n=1 Tax=Undibacterium sp. Di27W TaxID=3413036 RepID=UPI003BF3DAAA